jgi:hypothetical protein
MGRLECDCFVAEGMQSRTSQPLSHASVFGCGSELAHVPHVRHTKDFGEENGVIVTNVDEPAHATPIAEQYCKTQRRSAQVKKTLWFVYEMHTYTSGEFDCLLSP